MLALVDRPNALDLSGLTGLRRLPARPPERRGPDFAERYDDTTLFFDAFLSPDGRRAVLIGPPFLNLAQHLAPLTAIARPSGAACRPEIRALDRLVEVWFDVPAGTEALTLETGFGPIAVALVPSGAESFRDRRTIVTLSKDNPIPWILDWVRFNRDRHGADAVLFYDNGSTAYPPEALADALASLEGIRAARVVHWPFKYGPQGTLTGDWDSDYCQNGVLEQARWRYLPLARAVLNCDIDEFVVPEGGGASVFEAVERSLTGVLAFPGRWVVGRTAGDAPAEPEALPLHRDFDAVLKPAIRRRFGLLPVDTAGCSPKWAAVPRRCPARAQWRAHSIPGWPFARARSRVFGFRHFRPICTNWKYDRGGVATFDPTRHERDTALVTALAGVDWAR